MPGLFVPLALWGNAPPSYGISCLSYSEKDNIIVTGSRLGQLCIWDYNVKENKASPRQLLIGHCASTCEIFTLLQLVDAHYTTTIISISEDG